MASALTAQSHIMDAVALSSTLVLFTYHTNTGYVQTVANTISISGTAITLNTAANNPDATTTGGVLQFLSSTSAVWMGLKLLSAAYYYTARVISVSGTTITWNGNSDSASQGATAITLNGYPTGVVNKAASQSYYIIGQTVASGSAQMAYWWISGTTVTYKSVFQFSAVTATIWASTYPSRGAGFTMLAQGAVTLLSFQFPEVQVTGFAQYVPISSSGGVVGTPYFAFGNNTSNSGLFSSLMGMDRIADDCIIVGGVNSSTSPAAGISPIFQLCEVGPQKIDRMAEGYQPDTSHTVTGAWVGRLTDDIAICAWASSTDLYFGALRRRRRVAGIAVDASGTIVRRGRCKGLAGLTPGARYFMSDLGALQTAGTDLPVGIALTANTLEVDIGKAA